MRQRPYTLTIIVFLICNAFIVSAQYLDKKVSIEQKKQPLKTVLKNIGRLGGFEFSYNSSIIAGDSLVDISAKNKTVRQILQQLIGSGYQFTEKENYVIILRGDGTGWYINGRVLNLMTDEPLSNVSVYDPDQLTTTLTNANGVFKLRMKEHSAGTIRISKSFFHDTTISVSPDEELVIRIQPNNYGLDNVLITSSTRVENSVWGKIFLSSRQRIQSMNLSKFFVDKPYQASLVPGIGTHGSMSGQVKDGFSFNILGGYTAAINGFELGGLFNIVKGDVQYVEIAGVFNLAGGKTRGVQVGGVFNYVLDTVKAVQVGGVTNIVTGAVNGVQVSGLYNQSMQDMRGVQMAGIFNYARRNTGGAQLSGVANFSGKKTKGLQLAGVGNISAGDMRGVQLSGVFNYAKKLSGFQLGVINIADSSSGCSLGLINIALKNGYYKFSAATNEVMQLNLAAVSGTKKLYSMLLVGGNVDPKNKCYAFGYGLGTVIDIGKRFSITPELSTQNLYRGDWEHMNLLNRAQAQVHFKLHRYFSIHAGPAYSFYYSDQGAVVKDYAPAIPTSGYKVDHIGDKLTGWVGWSAGISIF